MDGAWALAYVCQSEFPRHEHFSTYDKFPCICHYISGSVCDRIYSWPGSGHISSELFLESIQGVSDVVSMGVDGATHPSPFICYLIPHSFIFQIVSTFYSTFWNTTYPSYFQQHRSFACVDFSFCEVLKISLILLHVNDCVSWKLPYQTTLQFSAWGVLTHPPNLVLSGPFLELGSTDSVKLDKFVAIT